MVDLREGNRPASWLETELARQLCPVTAPESLWRRIHEQRRPLRVGPHPWTAWSIAGAALLMLLAGLVWRLGAARGRAEDLENLAALELRQMAQGLEKSDFQSSDPGEIQRWVKAKLNVDVPLPERSEFGNQGFAPLGVRLIRLDPFSTAAVIAYRVGGKRAAMLVADKRPGFSGGAGPGHSSLRLKSKGDVMLYSWSLGANDYAIAFAGTREPGRPCLLCHTDSPALIVFR